MKILVIQMKMIGDVLTSSILFEALRKKYPEAELHYLIYKQTQPVVENNPFIDKIIPFDPANKDFYKLWELSRRIQWEQYDIVIDVYSKINSAFLTALSGAKKRISYHKWYTRKGYTQTFRLKEQPNTLAGLAVENRMMLLKGISNNFPKEIQPKIYLTATEKFQAKEKLTEAGISSEKPLFMVGILGSSANKTYPLHYMAQVLDFIIDKTQANLLFNYIPQQEEQAKELFSKCNAKTQKNIHFGIYGKSLREFMALTSCCDAFIGNEGGAANMAKASGVPTFSIFSPQIKKENWSIYEDGKKHVSVHLRDFEPTLIEGTSKKRLSENAIDLYELLIPNLIFAPLEYFLNTNL
ncbi:MAG: glycosyltransferase family 9 protein [Bacteroidota bacterium]